MPDSPLLGLAVLAGVAIAYAITYRVKRGRAQPALRTIAAIEKIRMAMPEAAEDGRTVHVALGTSGLSDAGVMQTLAGLDVLDFLSEQSIVSSHAPLVTTADPTTMLAAQSVASRSLRARDQQAQFDPLNVRFIGGTTHAPAAYAAGVIELLERRTVAASYSLGQFGDEYLLVSEAAARSGTPEVAGSGNLQGLAFMALSARYLIVGEELFAAGAYLRRMPWHVAALVTSDIVRWLITAGLLAVVILKTIRLA
jgi:uncharacterized protein DUF6754